MATRTTSITSYNPAVSEIQSGLLAKSASIRTNLTNIETPLDQSKPVIESMWESLGAIERVTFVKSFDDAKVAPGTNSIDIDTGATTLGEVDSNYTVTERDGWASASLNVTGITSGVVWAIYPGLTYTATNDLPTSKPANAYRVLTFTNSGGTVTVNPKSFQKAIESDNNIFHGATEFKGKVTNNYPRLSAAVASNALTITLSGGSFSFRSSSLTSGLLTTLAVSSAVTLTIPSGTTIGTSNNDSSRIHIYAINNAGTIELALSGNPGIDTSLVFNTTAISGGTSRDALYSTTARTSVPVVYLGFITAPQATAGTWASAPTQIVVTPQYASPTAQLRLSTGNGHGSTNTTIRRFATIVEDRSAGYFTYADSATAGASFTINLGGLYSISYSDGASAASSRVGISRNSTQLTTSVESITNADRLQAILVASGLIGNVAVSANLLPGDIIRPHTSGAPNFNTAGNTAFVMTYMGG